MQGGGPRCRVEVVPRPRGTAMNKAPHPGGLECRLPAVDRLGEVVLPPGPVIPLEHRRCEHPPRPLPPQLLPSIAGTVHLAWPPVRSPWPLGPPAGAQSHGPCCPGAFLGPHGWKWESDRWSPCPRGSTGTWQPRQAPILPAPPLLCRNGVLGSLPPGGW